MTRTPLAVIAVAVLIGATQPVTADGIDVQEAGIPAQVVDWTPQSTVENEYPTTDYGEEEERDGTTSWRVVAGTGNAAELWLTTTAEGRILDLGGRYINYTDDDGLTWKSVRPLEPLVNAEGSVVVAPNGDVIGVTWDPYSGDRVINYKYSAAEDEWYYVYNAIHTPFWDRPGLAVIPGSFEGPLGESPYLAFIDGFPHDPWYYGTDGLHYPNLSSRSRDAASTDAIETWLDVDPDPSFDWIQPNARFPMAPLGNGDAVAGRYIFTAEDMRWHSLQLPQGSLPTSIQVDSQGRLHAVARSGGGFEYRMSPDGGRTWNVLEIPDASPGDFQANAAAGVAAVWALDGQQDLVYKIDITEDEPELLRRYVVGLGDDCRCGTLGTYGLTGGHRFDFSSIAILPSGRVAVSFMDSTTQMSFPTLGTDVVAPALAIELETSLD